MPMNSGPVMPLLLPVLADRLADRQDMRLVEGIVEGRAAMARGAERDALRRDRRIRLAGEIGRHQPRHIHQHRRLDRFAGFWACLGRHRLSPLLVAEVTGDQRTNVSLRAIMLIFGTQSPADLCRKSFKEIEIVGASGGLADPFVDPMGIVADQDAPLIGLDAIEDDGRRCRRGGRRLLLKALCPLGRSFARMSLSDIADASVAEAAIRARACAISVAVISSDSLPLWILRELVTIEVPMWPGMTTEH